MPKQGEATPLTLEEKVRRSKFFEDGKEVDANGRELDSEPLDPEEEERRRDTEFLTELGPRNRRDPDQNMKK